MRLEEALAFIQDTSWQGCRPGLERITELMYALKNPQETLRFVHVAGTNGKGSTAIMLAAILTNAGYKTGLFTSPHLVRYHERIKINGIDISDEELCMAAEAVKSAVDGLSDAPSEFERFTAMAFWHFHRRKCDIVILEVGLGGRLDATNVISAPAVAVITNIGLEHTEYLGETLEQIAAEKAGIIKPGSEVVLYQQTSQVESVIRQKCAAYEAPLHLTDFSCLTDALSSQLVTYRNRDGLQLALLGTYQRYNAAAVLETVDVLQRLGWEIPEEAVRKGLAHAEWPGRFELLQCNPCVLLDGAHNPNGVQALVEGLSSYVPGKKMIFVMGVMADKAYEEMLQLAAPLAKLFVTVTPENKRALDAENLCAKIQKAFHLPAKSAGNVTDGITVALRESGPEDVICIFGSLYQAGEVRLFFGK